MTTLENSTKMPNRFEILSKLKVSIGQRGLRSQYQQKPLTMHKMFPANEPMKFPAVIKSAYAKIWSGKYPRIIIKAPRGGGKSKLLGTFGFDDWYLRQRKVVNMAGSAVQATIVYNYFKDYCEIDASIEDSIKGKAKAMMTTSVTGNYFSSVTASSKQVRGKHPDTLISDETCETSDELVHSALPMVDSSQKPLVVMASTFHKIFGVFQETWDNAEQRGYLRIQWDIFDVTKQFPADYWETGRLADGTLVKNIAGVEKLIAHAAGRTGDPEGWVNIENIIQAWREKPTEDWFEVEYMGSRPSAAGLVLKPEDVDRSLFDSQVKNAYTYVNGATVVIGIDWGFSSMTAVTEYMQHVDQVVVQLDCRTYHQIASDDIIKNVVEQVRRKKVRVIYADSAGKFENDALRTALIKANLPCRVVEVVFSKEKEGMLGNLRAHFENGKIKIPIKVKRVDEKGHEFWVVNESYWQLKRYRYQEGSDKPVKKDDHIPDSSMCALQHFKLGVMSRSLPKREKIDNLPPGSERPITADTYNKKF